MSLPRHNQGKEQLSQFYRTFYPRMTAEEQQRIRAGFQQIKTRDPIPRQSPLQSDFDAGPLGIRLLAGPDNGDGGGGGSHVISGIGGSLISGGSHVSGSGSGASGSGSGAASGSGGLSGDTNPASGEDSGTLGSGWGSGVTACNFPIPDTGCEDECRLTICGSAALIGCKNTRCPGTNGESQLVCCATDRLCSTGQLLITDLNTSGMPSGPNPLGPGSGLGSGPPPPPSPCQACWDTGCRDLLRCLPYNVICCYDDCSWLAYFGGYCCSCA